ncbi:class I SAM-dependent methyltransferase [Conexibacter sp. JD483]|uniref:class I SAM-dependent methyltransferase n=1 Tax=unclassified Conexibacter TaxID=2627773 RepID=UPI00271FCB00|nr:MULTISPECIES: class I SAM-dependent methyltransferase [unclassified Conexibacter]MDO8186937.1 class I SAM-dependent methyltransferase [Conexibacter sp. CPCC 205706]MDO8200608.1 class I SAM-dependent methyltransferase [Conexibacter sp. CPCC 205762]MDR9368814.1 class I SAM-dependent methyltransferase [Conexibacter sp. JD483]
MAAGEVRNPLFARLYSRVLAPNEPAEMKARRRELLAGLQGRVVELGAGAGTNFPLYPETVAEVVAVEPEPYMREQARTAAARDDVRVRVTVVDGIADALPLEDRSCDAAVACLVLCSVPDQATALAELRRVLKDDGELRFFEHVLARDRLTSTLQHVCDRTFWPHAFGGCHTARDTAAAIAAAGFAIDRQRRIRAGAFKEPPPVAEQAIGRATVGARPA